MAKNGNVKKPPKKAKKERVTFDKIDVTTATEDDIIQSGIRYNTGKDKFCYFVMFLIFVLALTPVLLRFSMPKKITEEMAEIAYTDVTCYRTVAREGYELASELFLQYRDGNPTNAKLSFTTSKVSSTAAEEYVFFEVNELNAVKESSGFVKTEEGNKNIYEIDFKKDKSLFDEQGLKGYSYVVGAEIDYLKGRNYRCKSDIKNVNELINIETREKVEDK